MIGNARSVQVLGIPEDRHLTAMRVMFLDYRGRVAVVLDRHPDVTIIGKVIRARYDPNNCRVMLFLNRAIKDENGREQVVVDVFPRQVRDYYITGMKDDSPVSCDHCPAKMRLLD